MNVSRTQPVYATLQLLSLAVVAVTFAVCAHPQCWYPLFLGLVFTHYILAVVYSKHRFVSIFHESRSWIPLVCVVAAGSGLYAYDFPLYIYFAVHHALNEVYMPYRTYRGEERNEERIWRFSGIVLHVCAVFVIVNAGNPLAQNEFLFPASVVFLAAFVVYISCLHRQRHRIGAAELLNYCLLEVILLILVPLSFFYSITIYHIVFYHVVYWAMFPFVGMYKQGKTAAAGHYLGMNVIFIASFVVGISAAASSQIVTFQMLHGQFLFWSFVHITLAFATSSAQPKWIRHWFEPRRFGVAQGSSA